MKRRLDLAKATFSVWLTLVALVFSLSSCSDTKEPISKVVTPAFYHWETRLQLSQQEVEYLDQYEVDQLYVRFFDVDRTGGDGEPVPVAATEIDTSGLTKRKIIPVIFITNRTLQNLSEIETDSLADRLLRKVLRQWNESFQQGITELQIDCDWSETTGAVYFHLLERLKKKLPKPTTLSATIRLHQVKYFQRTGVPPVDRGMLMYYNMGEVSNWRTKNSILDTLIAAQYLFNFDRYPLSLDVALPAFSWGAIFRDEKLVQLVHHLDESTLLDTTRFVLMEEQRFSVKKSTYLEGFYCYQGDVIRLEKIKESLLNTARRQLQEHLKNENRRVVFYHLHDQLNLEKDLWKDW